MLQPRWVFFGGIGLGEAFVTHAVVQVLVVAVYESLAFPAVEHSFSHCCFSGFVFQQPLPQWNVVYTLVFFFRVFRYY